MAAVVKLMLNRPAVFSWECALCFAEFRRVAADLIKIQIQDDRYPGALVGCVRDEKSPVGCSPGIHRRVRDMAIMHQEMTAGTIGQHHGCYA